MLHSTSLLASYSYNASTYCNFLAPRLGATAGPRFFVAPVVAEEDVVGVVLGVEPVDVFE